MVAIFWLINAVLNLYWWIVIIAVVLSWLFAFNIVNRGNPVVDAIAGFVYDMTEPVLAKIRGFMPNLGAVDISPIVLLLGITFLQIFINTSIAPMFLRPTF
ncbi:MAG: YggT family protein [Pseudomonadota bacterium]